MVNKDYLVVQGSQTLIRTYIKPGAKNSEIIGTYGDPIRLKIAINSPPVDGKANKALIKFLSKLFKLKLSEIEIIRGEQSRSKDLLLNLELKKVLQVLENI